MNLFLIYETDLNQPDFQISLPIGRWQPPYEPHTAPWEWSGSVAILEKYMEGQGRQPVKYGQCWVFSAVTTTSTINIKTRGGK